ncbi:hypothetical protein PCANC_25711 [Puccinia coronata f. sp. avenae]|uniref:Uncharacterized protein n=1 Tax=Puccinia coronata f. sp. avenae TaxID=200324 RepID=A0A2N5S501_9BASI|nr:hypothetical protein PCANC_25711 [Puccinia coronata f. sp. avenae]
MAGFIEPLLSRLVPVLNSNRVVQSLTENSAVAIGWRALACPQLIAPHINQFILNWCGPLFPPRSVLFCLVFVVANDLFRVWNVLGQRRPRTDSLVFSLTSPVQTKFMFAPTGPPVYPQFHLPNTPHSGPGSPPAAAANDDNDLLAYDRATHLTCLAFWLWQHPWSGYFP